MTPHSDRHQLRSWAENGEPTANSHIDAGTHEVATETKKLNILQRLGKVPPSKLAEAGACLASIVMLVLSGFIWGGWVTIAEAGTTANSSDRIAIVERLAPICVAQFNADPDKAAKLAAMSGMSTFQTANYVQEQGWATIAGADMSDRQVADACVKLLTSPYKVSGSVGD